MRMTEWKKEHFIGLVAVASLFLILGAIIGSNYPLWRQTSPVTPVPQYIPIPFRVYWNFNQSFSDKYFGFTHFVVLLVTDNSSGHPIIIYTPKMECQNLTCFAQGSSDNVPIPSTLIFTVNIVYGSGFVVTKDMPVWTVRLDLNSRSDCRGEVNGFLPEFCVYTG